MWIDVVVVVVVMRMRMVMMVKFVVMLLMVVGVVGLGRSSVDITRNWMSSVLARKDFEIHFLISHNQVMLFLT